MPVAEKIMMIHDHARDRDVTVEAKSKAVVLLRWPCGAEYEVKRTKLRAALAMLDGMPKPPKGISYAITVDDIYEDSYGYKEAATFALEDRARKVRVRELGDEEEALLSIAELRKVVDL